MISITPTSSAKKNLRELAIAEFRFRTGLRHAMFEIGQDAARGAEQLINNQARDGILYEIQGFPHRASSPGQAPANLSGKLKRSFSYLVRGHDELEWGSTAPHAVFLEEGTSKMEPRPFLQKIQKLRGQLYANFLEERVDYEIKRRR